MFYVKFYRKLSNAIGYVIICVTGILYIQKLLMEPVDKVTNVALTAIGAVAALSALCFTFAPLIEDEHDKKSGLYAGEKFLHSTLLIILTLFLKYANDQLISFEFISSIKWLKVTIICIFSMPMFGIGSFAVGMAALGFHDLNKTLWFRYEQRAKENLKKK
jgi:hypothetical protein